MPTRTRSTAAEVPHSWDLEHWPAHVYPHTEERARYVIRAHRDELIREGALARVGRELIIFGKNYDRWLQMQRGEVKGFVPPPNRERGQAA